MPDEHVQGFLDAEHRATELITQLEKLYREVESYGVARESLEKVSKTLSEHASRLGALTSEVRSVIEALQQIGTPELLRRLDQTTQKLDDVRIEVTASTMSGFKRLETALLLLAAILVAGIGALAWLLSSGR